MEFFEKLKEYTKEEMARFMLNHINSDCRGEFDECCEEEGYKDCMDCCMKFLSRKCK